MPRLELSIPALSLGAATCHIPVNLKRLERTEIQRFESSRHLASISTTLLFTEPKRGADSPQVVIPHPMTPRLQPTAHQHPPAKLQPLKNANISFKIVDLELYKVPRA